MLRPPRHLAAPVVAALVALATGCGKGGDDRDPTAFCARLGLVQSALTDPTDPAALVALYDDLDDEAPLQIKDDWHQITLLLGTVTTYDPTDDAESQEVVRAVLRSQTAVTAVAVWARDSCRIELGPIPATVPIGGTGDELLSDAPVPTDPPESSDPTDSADGSDPATNS